MQHVWWTCRVTVHAVYAVMALAPCFVSCQLWKNNWCDACAVHHPADHSRSPCNLLSAGKTVMGRQEVGPPMLEDKSSSDAEDSNLDDLLTCLGIEEAKAQL